MRYRRELNGAKSESDYLGEIIITLASEQELLFRERFDSLRQYGAIPPDTEPMLESLIKGCGTVISDAALGHKSVHEAYKEYLKKSTSISWDSFAKFLEQQDGQVLRHWQKNSVSEYFFTCKILLDIQEKRVRGS
ncbi:hypothetical protein [Algicola sagamiensis]|uniref:hypothetical protein n=1 Tax=Algicola sagamiensis TaxID=163869 RepID=UPI00039DF650|nr:hypothetical protein [Algicola sagamiensis]